MSQTVAVNVTLFADQTGLTLEAQPYAGGATSGAVVTGTTLEIGGGSYIWTASVPDNATKAAFLDHATHTSLNVVEDFPVATLAGAVLVQNGSGSGQILAFGGAVQVGAYSGGQDPGTLILQNPATRIYADGDGYVSIPTGSSVNVATISGSTADLDGGNLIVSVGRWAGLVVETPPAVPGDAMTLTPTERTSIGLAVWNTLRSVTFAVGSFGEKFKLWLLQLGTDNRVLVSSSTHTSGETVAGVTGGVGGGGASTEEIVAALEEADFAKTSAVDIDVTVELPG